MALFNHLFPYSNLHDINLDWIISIIKSIDPAVIQALQELTPDIIEQVNQKVSEAQAAAIAAQSSASEANTARENAATSAAVAAQDATEAAADAATAESAKTAIENSLTPVPLTATFADFVNLTSQNMWRSGAVTYIAAFGSFNSTPETPDYPTLVTFPTGVGETYQTIPIIISAGTSTELTLLGVTERRCDIYKGSVVSGRTFLLFGLLK